MRVTDEMVEAAARAVEETIAQRHGNSVQVWMTSSRREVARAALEAALAVEGTEAKLEIGSPAWREERERQTGICSWCEGSGRVQTRDYHDEIALKTCSKCGGAGYTTPPAGIREALEAAGDAMDEYYRYWTGGESRGSYDGKPERQRLWAAMHTVKAARAALRGQS